MALLVERPLNPACLQIGLLLRGFPGNDVETTGQVAILRMALKEVSGARGEFTLLFTVDGGRSATKASMAACSNFHEE